MISGFKTRKPWAAAIIALLLGPFIGMCYVYRGRLAFVYLAFQILLAALPFAAAEFDILNANPLDVMGFPLWGLQIIGAIHAFLIAKRHDYPEPLKWYSRWYALAAFIIVPLMLAFAFRHLCYEPFHVPASSMSPNVNKGDYLFAKNFAYSTQTPERGDIIIFKVNDVSFIKRVIGLPGDKVQIKDSLLYINDVQVPRKQMEDYALKDSKSERTIYQFVETLPEGKEYKILDETLNSPFDSTPVYTVPANQYFVLGDNRDQSRDSRDQENIGFVPQENITGKAAVILWNSDERKFVGIK